MKAKSRNSFLLLVMGLILIGLNPGGAFAQDETTTIVPTANPAEVLQAIAATEEVERLVSPEELDLLDQHAREAITALEDIEAEPDLDRQTMLATLRSQLASDRDFSRTKARDGSLEARLIEAQIDALGPIPAEGETEPPAITERREILNQRLSAQLGPVLEMQEAEARAAALVTELDSQITEMETNRKWRQGRLMVDPRLWVDGITQWWEVGAAVAREVPANLLSTGTGEKLLRIAIALILIAIGPYLLGNAVRSKLITFLQRRFLRARTQAGKLAVALVEDVLSAFVVFIAMLLGIVALGLVFSLILDMTKALSLVLVIFLAALVVAIGSWLGHSTLRSPFPELRLIQLTSEQARLGVRLVRNLSITIALVSILAAGEQSGWIKQDAFRLTDALLVIAGCWQAWRLANVIKSSRGYLEAVEQLEQPDEEDQDEAARLDLSGTFAKTLKAFALVSGVAAMGGYVSLSLQVFIAIIASLAVLAAAVFAHRSIKLVIGMFAKGAFMAYRSILTLLPILTGLLIAIGTIPLFAYIWGYRAEEIGDALLALRTGVTFGDVTLSIGDVFKFAVVFVAGFVLTKWLQRFMRAAVLPQTDIEAGAQSAIVTGIGYVGIILAAVAAIASTGLDLSSLAFVFGALSVGLGFGLQKVVENFTSGILLLIERPIREGDWVEVGNHSGIVKKISVRSTHIETWDRHRIIIPNSEFITSSVKNYSLSEDAARIIVPIGVAYGSDLGLVRDSLLEVAAAHENVLSDPSPVVAMDDFGDSSINVKLMCFVDEVTTGAPTISDLKFAIAAKFADRGIEIPFPQRDVNIVERSGGKKLLAPS